VPRPPERERATGHRDGGGEEDGGGGRRHGGKPATARLEELWVGVERKQRRVQPWTREV
jgi:hypothetical protein